MNDASEPGSPAKSNPRGPLRDFTGRVVVMSGGSRGIGLAIAKALAREGARVAIIAQPSTDGLSE